MTREEIGAWFANHFDAKCDEFGLGHWGITVDVKVMKKCAGKISPHFEYERAHLKINPDSFLDRDEAYLVQVVEHELGHIIHAPMGMLMDAARSVMSDAEYAMFVQVWHKAQELTVCQIERTVRNVRRFERTPKETDATTPPQ